MTTRATTKNAALTAQAKEQIPGIHLTNGVKLVGVLFNSDMATVLGFVITFKGGSAIETPAEFAKRGRLSDYVDARGRCVPKKLREFQQRTGKGLPYSRVYSNTATGKDLDPKTVTAAELNTLIRVAFVPLPEYAMIENVIRRAPSAEKATYYTDEKGVVQTRPDWDYVKNEGIIGLSLLLHYPAQQRFKKVKDAKGVEKKVAYKTKERDVSRTVQIYNAYSLPFTVLKYAIKHSKASSHLATPTPLSNYYLSIKDKSMPTIPVKDPANPRKGYTVQELSTNLLDPYELGEYSPADDRNGLIISMYLDETEKQKLVDEGVFIRGAKTKTPISALKTTYTTKNLLDDFEEADDVIPEGQVVTENGEAVATVADTAPTEAEVESEDGVFEMPAIEESDVAPVAAPITASAPSVGANDEEIDALFEGIDLVDRVGLTEDGDLNSPKDNGVSLPIAIKNSALLGDNDAKVLKKALDEWNELCVKLEQAANAIAAGLDYTYDGEAKKLEVPKLFTGMKGKLCEEEVSERSVRLIFGDTKKGPKGPVLSLNSINVQISRKFYMNLSNFLKHIPVKSEYSYDTVTLYAFDGKPSGSKGFGIDLPSGEHFTSSDIHERLKSISKLMHSLNDDLVQTSCGITFLNAGCAAAWRQSIKEARKDLGLNSAAVARSKSLEKRVVDELNSKYSESDAATLRTISLPLAFGENNSIAMYKEGTIAFDPVTSEYRGGYHQTRSEYTVGGNVARAIDDMLAEDGKIADYKPSASKQVKSFIEAQRTREGGTPWTNEKRAEAIAKDAAASVIADLKNETEVSSDFDWTTYEALKAVTICDSALKQIGKEKTTGPSSSDYSLSFDMHLGADDIAGMKFSGEALAEDDPRLVGAAERLNDNVKGMVLWLLATVGVGENTNDGLQFVGGDDATPGLWTDKSKAAREGAATRTRTFEYATDKYTFAASLKQPVE